jgi:hypothetical protein
MTRRLGRMGGFRRGAGFIRRGGVGFDRGRGSALLVGIVFAQDPPLESGRRRD